MTAKQHLQRAEVLIRNTGARVTQPRVEVLAALLAAEHALTHQELERRVARSREIDRVTIYRVLEWLTEHTLAHKISGDDRVWRFNAAGHAQKGSHAHFECNDCGQVLCLEPVSAKPTITLPVGYHQLEIELMVKGLCADCGHDRHKLRMHGRHQR